MTSLTTMTSRVRSAARRRKSRKNSRKKQRPRLPTLRQTGTGNVTSQTTHMPDSVCEITTPAFERTTDDSWGRVPGERRPLNRKSTTATNRQTGNSYAASSSVHRLPIATVVPYANLGAETRNDDVTSGELAWNGSGASLTTIVGLATVSVLAFWLVVTVIVLSCLLARRTATTTSAKQPTGCVVDARWSWSAGNQLIGLLDEEDERVDVSVAPRWNSADATTTSYDVVRQQTSSADDRRPAPTNLLDTLALAAILDEPEATSYYDECGRQTELWLRRTEQTSGSRPRRPVTSQRRFPRMGQSCLHRASPLRSFTDVTMTSSRRDVRRARLTGYVALPRCSTVTDVATTAV